MKDMAFLLRVLFGAALRAFFPALFAEAKKSLRDSAEDARPQPELKNRLQRRIRSRWATAVMVATLAFACLAGAGCGTKAYFVPEGEPVRLRAPVKRAKVWVMGADGVPVAATCTLAPGLYVLSDPGADVPEDKADGKTSTDSPSSPSGFSAPPDIPIMTATPAPIPLYR